MKSRLAVALALMSALFLAQAAIADPPDREVRPAFEDFTTDVCGFPVLIHEEGYALVKTWVDDEGNQRIIETYPGLTWTLTNVLTDEQITIVNTGPAKLEIASDGSGTLTGSGRWVWRRAHPVTGEPGIFLSRGHFVATFGVPSPAFDLFGGSITALCPLLA